MNFSISEYQPEDFFAILSLFQKSLPAENISEALFAKRVLLDPNFRNEGLLLAKRSSGEICGATLAMLPQFATASAAIDCKSWITLFAIAPDCRGAGIGSALFNSAENWLKSTCASSVHVSPYPQGYWTPGVDETLYPEALAFLKNRGYEVSSRPLSMSVNLASDWNIPDWASLRMKIGEAEGLRIVSYAPSYSRILMDFLHIEFPGDWERHLKASMADILNGFRPPEEIQLIFDSGELIGFAQSEEERFGPFGVASSQRGKGVGAMLMYKTLQKMRDRGHQKAWFMWTNDTTAMRLYAPAGFEESRRFAVLKKEV